ncbi:MAG: NAD(P)/FAD-dependent oxidoreductase [Chloroflexi bacterium]|nr:NAD(P)/FAD-dependent oxidoreductase [Chloroflexota bacterium]
MTDYDVIIVGGRPAGATLAARLGMAGLRILLVERAQMPSLPGASCPIVYAPTLKMLDEIGADELAYARGTPRIQRMVNETPGLETVLTIPLAYGRDYAYAIDRSRFDFALWENACQLPTVDSWAGASLTDLLWDGENVVGAVIREAHGPQRHITSKLVIGADGRFSTVARKVGAPERDERDQHPASIYYAYWSGAEPYDALGPTAVAGGPGYGYGYLVMDSADGSTVVAFEGQSALLNPPAGQIDDFYAGLIAQNPPVARRLVRAERQTQVRGMKAIGNLYRQPGGPGWALVGDAYHQKDPIDGQGIYDAVLTAKLLAREVVDFFDGDKLWSEALVSYDQTSRRETYPMYMQTVERSRASLYDRPSPWARTLVRWMLQDPVMQEAVGMMLTRQQVPDQRRDLPLMIGAVMRGPLRELSQLLDRMAK